jgi:hypothetical protein
VLGIALFVFGFLGTVRRRRSAGEPDPPPRRADADDYRRVFTLQEAIMAAIALLAFVAAPWLAALYGAPPTRRGSSARSASRSS